jgi:hypothetical protein
MTSTASRRATAPSGPANVNFRDVQGGDDHYWTERFPFDLTGSTVTVELRLSSRTTTAPDLTLSSGSGLTITYGAASTVRILIPKTLAMPTFAEEIYYLIRVVDTAGLSKTYQTGVIPVVWMSIR